MASFLRVARSTTAARRSTLLLASASVAAAPRARIAPQFTRGYATGGDQKKGGSAGVWLGTKAVKQLVSGKSKLKNWCHLVV